MKFFFRQVMMKQNSKRNDRLELNQQEADMTSLDRREHEQVRTVKQTNKPNRAKIEQPNNPRIKRTNT